MINRYLCLILLGFCGCANAVYDKGMSLDKILEYVGVYKFTAVEQSAKYTCGYACFASVALYYNISPELITDEKVCSEFQNKNLSATQFVEMANSVGLTAFAYQSNLEDIKTQLHKGRPMIVLLNSPPSVASWPSFQWARETSEKIITFPHWVVITAIGPDGNLSIHDPRRGRLKISQAKLGPLWKKQNNIAVLIGHSK